MRGLQKYLGLFPVLPFVVRKRVRVEVSREASKGERLFGWASAAQATVRGKKNMQKTKGLKAIKKGRTALSYATGKV